MEPKTFKENMTIRGAKAADMDTILKFTHTSGALWSRLEIRRSGAWRSKAPYRTPRIAYEKGYVPIGKVKNFLDFALL